MLYTGPSARQLVEGHKSPGSENLKHSQDKWKTFVLRDFDEEMVLSNDMEILHQVH